MNDNLLTQAEQLLKDAQAEIGSAQTASALEELEVKYLGRKGSFTELLKQIKDLPDEAKRTTGQAIQQTKKSLDESFSSAKKHIENTELAAKLNNEFFDLTFPSTKHPKGSIHPLSQLQLEVENIFSQMGFAIEDGPEVESEYYNFEALNIPADHPARDMQDTFFLEQKHKHEEGKLLLRTHTSPVQIRTMQKYGAPARIIVPGRVFRYEATDATHDSTFNQVEGLLIDEGVNLSHLKAIMLEFLERLFNRKLTIRFRPGYFPFVEPGIELDILWKKDADGNEKWLEFMGAGMVHPNVLKAGGLDPEKYQGWAFGFGITRLALLRYHIEDIRHLHTNDLRFLQQF